MVDYQKDVMFSLLKEAAQMCVADWQKLICEA